MRFHVCQKAAITLKCPVVMCCQVGANGEIVFDGHSLYVDAQGEVAHEAKGFEEDDFVVDLQVKNDKKGLPERSSYHELLLALQLGIRDYVVKCGFQNVCIGLSGGVDSALVAYLATQALGTDRVLAISMPSCYTSSLSIEDAHLLADSLGIELKELPIISIVDTYQDVLQPHFNDKPSDVTEENLQARIRGNLLMAISNKHGHLLLSTGNKSELAVGFTTLYGDMCGGLCVLGDVTKTRVYELCRYINDVEGRSVISESIMNKAPSAELRPNQVDQDVLPEYYIVDAVLEGYVEECLSVQDIAARYQIAEDTVVQLVESIHRSEYKRLQGPPVLKVTKKAFGKGRRYPLVQQWL